MTNDDGTDSGWALLLSLQAGRHVDFVFLVHLCKTFESQNSTMPRIHVQGLDAEARRKHPREFSLLQQLTGSEGIDSEVRWHVCCHMLILGASSGC